MTITSKEKWGFDSNILIYALDMKSPYYLNTKKFFTSTELQNLFIAQQNIVEIEKVMVTFYRLNKNIVTKILNSLLEAFEFNIITPRPTTLRKYHELLRTYKRKSFFDLYLAATYLDNDIKHFFTLNLKDFKNIPGFTAINPFKLV